MCRKSRSLQKKNEKRKRSESREEEETISVFVEEAESFLELGDLVIGKLIRHYSSSDFLEKILLWIFLVSEKVEARESECSSL